MAGAWVAAGQVHDPGIGRLRLHWENGEELYAYWLMGYLVHLVMEVPRSTLRRE